MSTTRASLRGPAPRLLLGATALVLTVAACGGGGAAGPGAVKGATGDGPDAAAGAGGRDGGSGPSCSGPGYAGTAGSQTFSHLAATVVDADGNAVPTVSAQVCGTNICLNGTTATDGSVVIDQTATLKKPAFKYGGGIAYAKFAHALDLGPSGSVDLTGEITVAFDPPDRGAPLTPGTSAVSRGVTLTLPAGMSPPAPDPFDFDTPALQGFRAAELPPGRYPRAVDPSLGFETVVALTPVGTELCPAAKLTLPNTPGWPAGAAVEVFLHGVDVAEQWAPYGGWAKVSNGAVSQDGSSIETTEGEGLPALSVVGVRLAR